MGTVAFADASVAKVGNTEYATIDEAIVYHEDECLGAYEIKSENGITRKIKLGTNIFHDCGQQSP